MKRRGIKIRQAYNAHRPPKGQVGPVVGYVGKVHLYDPAANKALCGLGQTRSYNLAWRMPEPPGDVTCVKCLQANAPKHKYRPRQPKRPLPEL